MENGSLIDSCGEPYIGVDDRSSGALEHFLVRAGVSADLSLTMVEG